MNDLKLIECDHCGATNEVAVMLVSLNPTGERIICEGCFERGGRRLSLHFLRMIYAWDN